jgi:lipase maturation factor 1
MIDGLTFVYDGECGFCLRWVDRFRAITGKDIEYIPSEKAIPLFPHIDPSNYDKHVVLVRPSGDYLVAAQAIIQMLSYYRVSFKSINYLYNRFFIVRSALELSYRIVAGHRRFFSKLI